MSGEPVYLRALQAGDLEQVNKWHNDRSLYATLLSPFRHVSKAGTEEWLANKQKLFSEINLAICCTDNSQHIGNIYVRDIDLTARHGELHILIGESDQRNKGYGQSAVRQLIAHAFRDLGLHRLYLYVIEGNDAATRAYEKCGFLTEGVLRAHTFKDGRFLNVIVMGLCANEAHQSR